MMQQSFLVSMKRKNAVDVSNCNMRYGWNVNVFFCCFHRNLCFFRTGSLSKGSDDNVRSLIEAGLIQVLLKIITSLSADKHLMEILLCVVRSIYEHPFAPKEIINTTSTLSYLIGT